MTLVDDLTTQPWERASGESARNFHHFQHFMHLPPWQRSMRQAYTDHQAQCLGKVPLKNLHVPPDLQALRLRFSWVERAAAHDADVAARDRLQKIADIAAMSARHIGLAVATQNLAVQRLQEIATKGEALTMTPLQLIRLIALATDVERRARGLPTEIVEHQNEPTGGGLLDLSALTVEELRTFELLVRKAEPRAQTGGTHAD